MKMWAPLVILILAGCGTDPVGGFGDAGDACRPPPGCTSRILQGRCVYPCAVSDAGNSQSVCLRLPDGGVVDFVGDGGLGFPPEIVASGTVYAFDPGLDPRNCNRCGNVCAPGERCRFARPGVPGGCYQP